MDLHEMLRADTFDSRDVIARIEALESYERDDTESDELVELRAFAEYAESCCDDWVYGVVIIADSYFEEYAEELASDLGAWDRENAGTWPTRHIDWEAAARDLRQDYTMVILVSTDFWVR